MGFLWFGHKSVSKEFLTKEVNDLSSLDNYSKSFNTELKTKIRPTIAKLQEKASKGKSLSGSDIEALNGYEEVIATSLNKYSALKDALDTDSNFENLRNDGNFKLIKNYLDDITTGRSKISGLSTAHTGAASEVMSRLKTILGLIDSNIEVLEGISFNVKKIEANISVNLKDMAA